MQHLGGDAALLARLEQEFALTTEWLRRIRGTSELLADAPVLRAAIAVRNPYVDVLSVLQVALLARKRREGEQSARIDAMNDALATTLNGVAQGLRNTG